MIQTIESSEMKNNMCDSGMARHGMAWHGMAWHGMAWNGMAWHGMAWHGLACRAIQSMDNTQSGFVTIWAQAYQFVYASVLAFSVSAVHGLWPGFMFWSLSSSAMKKKLPSVPKWGEEESKGKKGTGKKGKEESKGKRAGVEPYHHRSEVGTGYPRRYQAPIGYSGYWGLPEGEDSSSEDNDLGLARRNLGISGANRNDLHLGLIPNRPRGSSWTGITPLHTSSSTRGSVRQEVARLNVLSDAAADVLGSATVLLMPTAAGVSPAATTAASRPAATTAASGPAAVGTTRTITTITTTTPSDPATHATLTFNQTVWVGSVRYDYQMVGLPQPSTLD